MSIFKSKSASSMAIMLTCKVTIMLHPSFSTAYLLSASHTSKQTYIIFCTGTKMTATHLYMTDVLDLILMCLRGEILLTSLYTHDPSMETEHNVLRLKEMVKSGSPIFLPGIQNCKKKKQINCYQCQHVTGYVRQKSRLCSCFFSLLLIDKVLR